MHSTGTLDLSILYRVSGYPYACPSTGTRTTLPGYPAGTVPGNPGTREPGNPGYPGTRTLLPGYPGTVVLPGHPGIQNPGGGTCTRVVVLVPGYPYPGIVTGITSPAGDVSEQVCSTHFFLKK